MNPITWKDLMRPLPCEWCGNDLADTEAEDGVCWRCCARAVNAAWGDKPCSCAPVVERVAP